MIANLTNLYSKLPFGAAALTSALHLGLGSYFGYSGVMSSSLAVHIEQRAVGISGSMLPGADGVPTTFIYNITLDYRHGSRFSTRVSFDDISIGHASGTPSLSAGKFGDIPRQPDELDNSVAEFDSLTDAEFEVDNGDGTISESTWKQRYMKLRAQMQKRERSLSQYKRKILESVMADL
jgi:hypothetical protein